MRLGNFLCRYFTHASCRFNKFQKLNFRATDRQAELAIFIFVFAYQGD